MYKRVVIKIGTRVISDDSRQLDRISLQQIVDQVAELRKRSIDVVVVTSGAVGAGRSLLTLKGDEDIVVQKQIFSAVGQVKLMSIYSDLFKHYKYLCAQVLVTKGDFRDRIHYLNMRNCFEGLLLDEVIPIVNENDVITTTELLFTDNDELAGLVASQLNADALIILTSVDGVIIGDARDETSSVISEIDPNSFTSVKQHITTATSFGGRGGMLTKLATAKKLSEQGIATHIINGRKVGVILDVIEGKKIGTKFIASRRSSALKRRLAHSEDMVKGIVHVNECTGEILKSKSKIISLLPIGIIAVSGEFSKGDVIEIQSVGKERLGYGVAQYGSEKVNELKGIRGGKPVIHYNYMFIG